MREIRIGETLVGDGHPTYVILEIARTYSSLDEAAEMIRIAANEGVNAIKIQSIFAKELMVENKNTFDYVKMLEGLERSREEHVFLQKVCKENNIDFLSTPEGPGMADLLQEIGTPAFKVSSLNLVYYPLLRKLASTGKPVILSTGMGKWDEIDTAVRMFSESLSSLVLLHCSSTYPTNPEVSNLRNILSLRDMYNLVVGYSDHTVGPTAPAIAVALGASVIEKHFTLDRNQNGADHLVGVDPKMLKEMMSLIRETETLLGSKERRLCEDELVMRRTKRRKLVLKRALNAGDSLGQDNLACLQVKSEKGIDSKNYDNFMAKTLRHALPANAILEYGDIE